METYNLNKLIENIYFICNLKGIRIGQLEDELGMCKGYMSKLRKGDRVIGIHYLIDVANYLNMYIDDLFFYDPTEAILDGLKEEEKELERQIAELRERIKSYE